MNQRDLLIGANPFWLSMREQMYNCQKWLVNSQKPVLPRPMEGTKRLQQARFSSISVAVGILKMPSGVKNRQNRARWTAV